ncbi:hypothetical protein [Microcoleus sp.]|uniref:hypothetical protein n=1 Tax=Microcoleus sp. TaxID=44472 RepID=UPI0035243273
MNQKRDNQPYQIKGVEALLGTSDSEDVASSLVSIHQDLRRHTTYSVPKKGNRVFSPTAIVHTIKNLINQEITNYSVKQVLNVLLGISVPF